MTSYKAFLCPVAQVAAQVVVTTFRLSGIGDAATTIQRDVVCKLEPTCEQRGLLERCPVRKLNAQN